ncbi:hypothetical protein BU17DRAFT_43689 [Hysterangium stoloniferum]|nr:hypothetical protein BU17DRAFT_43689 [Hysterangium stoloniferum]
MSDKSARTGLSPSRRGPYSDVSCSDDEFDRAVSRFLAVKDETFAVSGSIPMPDVESTILFFRTSSGLSHSLPFPLKTDSMHQLPALNVLLATCETAPDAFNTAAGTPGTDSHDVPLVWPSHLPFSTTFDLASHPVLDTVRSVLFPKCYPGTYLYAVRDKFEVFLAGSSSVPWRPPSSRGADGAKRVATIILDLPVPYRGGALLVRSPRGEEERFRSPAQGTVGDTSLHWTAYLANCDREVEYVEQGCRMSISYGVHMKAFGPAGPSPNPLLAPNDTLLDALIPVLNKSRGRKLGVYLTGRYDCAPERVLADSLVPSLKGSDATLYHALKLYKLIPELRWVTTGHVWPVDKPVKLKPAVFSRQAINYPYKVAPPASYTAARQRRQSMPRSIASYECGSGVNEIGLTGMRGYGRSSRSVIYDSDDEEDGDLEDVVVDNGALRMHKAGITMLSPLDDMAFRAEVPVLSRGVMSKVQVNLILLFYVE